MLLDAAGQPFGFRSDTITTSIRGSDGLTCNPFPSLTFTVPRASAWIGRYDYRNYCSSQKTITNARYTFASSPEAAFEKNLGYCCFAVGNPVNPATGNKFQSETDYAAAPQVRLELRRFYNSQDPGSSGFGAGWRGNYDRTVILTDGGTVARITRADGRVDRFTKNGSGAWVSDPNVTSALGPVTSGSTQTGWTLTPADESVEAYHLSGKLLSITTREGQTTTLTYGAGSRVAAVTGPFGHVLSFAYNANLHLTQATTPDGRQYGYAYDANNNLVSVSYPDGKARTYL